MAPKQKKSPDASVAPFAAAPCPTILSDQATFEAAIVALTGLDATFMATLLGDGTLPQLRRRDPGYEGLASIIVAQQVSTASAAAIFSRLKARFGTLEATSVLAAGEDDLKLCGLSAPKMRTLRAIAEAVASGTLDLAALAVAEAEAAHEILVSIKGIGPWTADVFLLFCLGHADAWPAGDLALQEAAKLALGLPMRPTTRELTALGDRWRPLRGVAAHCLWAYYGTSRKRLTTLEDEIEVSPSAKARRKTSSPRKTSSACETPASRQRRSPS